MRGIGRGFMGFGRRAASAEKKAGKEGSESGGSSESYESDESDESGGGESVMSGPDRFNQPASPSPERDAKGASGGPAFESVFAKGQVVDYFDQKKSTWIPAIIVQV